LSLEVLAAFGEPRRMATGASGPSFEARKKERAPQDDAELIVLVSP
jgi:hypothetical protein